MILRPFTLDDAPAVQRLCADREIALNTLMIPHPYPEGAAAEWIGRHQKMEAAGEGEGINFAIEVEGELVGAIGLHFKPHDKAEIGYWIGVPFWGRGYATEAARKVLRYAFEQTAVNKVFAAHFSRNPASGRVLQKIGMRHEGTLRQEIKKWDEYVDVEMYAIVRSDGPSVAAGS